MVLPLTTGHWYLMGYTDIVIHDEESERPWIKWRVLRLDEPKGPWTNGTKPGYTIDPSIPFRSITLEIVNGQRSVLGV